MTPPSEPFGYFRDPSPRGSAALPLGAAVGGARLIGRGERPGAARGEPRAEGSPAAGRPVRAERAAAPGRRLLLRGDLRKLLEGSGTEAKDDAAGSCSSGLQQ